jgi:hypothetical protein
VWTVPANTVLTDAQVARLSAGAYYFNVQSDAFANGEIRGQLNQQLRFASLKGANEVPPVTTTASGVGVLAVNPTTRQFFGYVRVGGLSSAVTSALVQIGVPGVNGSPTIVLTNSGNGVLTVPPNTVLNSAQVANFNNGELYFNIHTVNNPQGELRGQIISSSVSIGTANLSGNKEIPPVASQSTGTGIMAWNAVTGEVSGSVKAFGVNGSSADIHSGSVNGNGPSLIALTTASPVTVAPTPGISFALDIQPIFNLNCAVSSCHVTGGIAPMSLEPSVSYARVILLVVPGNSSLSYLFRRINGVYVPQMPLNSAPLFRTPLSAADQNLIRDWIDSGALNN